MDYFSNQLFSFSYYLILFLWFLFIYDFKYIKYTNFLLEIVLSFSYIFQMYLFYLLCGPFPCEFFDICQIPKQLFTP